MMIFNSFTVATAAVVAFRLPTNKTLFVNICLALAGKFLQKEL